MSPARRRRGNLRAELARQQHLHRRGPAPARRRTAASPSGRGAASSAAPGPPAVRSTRSSTTWRPMSSRRPYCTPDGQVVSQLRQVRQRSRCSCVFAVTGCALQHLLDEVDAPARAVELVAQQLIGRAGRRAEAAVHAAAQDGVGLLAFRRVLDEIGERGLHGRSERRVEPPAIEDAGGIEHRLQPPVQRRHRRGQRMERIGRRAGRPEQRGVAAVAPAPTRAAAPDRSARRRAASAAPRPTRSAARRRGRRAAPST